MTPSQWITSNQIMDQITRLRDMGKGTFTWGVRLPDKEGTLTDFSIDAPIQAAFEKARLEKIVELQKQFEAL